MNTVSARRNREVQTYIEKFRMDAFLNERLLAELKLFRFHRHASIFIEQAEPTYLYFLVKGRLQCTHFHMNGKPAVIALTDPFAAIGDLEVMNNLPVYSNVIAMSPAELLGIPSIVVNRYGSEDPRFLRFLVDQLRQKLYRTNTLQATQVLPVISRLAVYVLSLAAGYVESSDLPGRSHAFPDDRLPVGKAICLPDKESLASMLGTTSRHLNRVLNELSRSGILGGDYPHLQILDRQRLQDVAEC